MSSGTSSGTTGPAWQYFTVSGYEGSRRDPRQVLFGRRDQGGSRYNCQMLTVRGTWEGSDYLQRYYLWGTNEDFLTDLSEAETVELLTRARELGRFPVAPAEPPGVAGP